MLATCFRGNLYNFQFFTLRVKLYKKKKRLGQLSSSGEGNQQKEIQL